MLKVFKKPKTINITITKSQKGTKKKLTRTVSIIVPNKSKETIEILKQEVQREVVTPLTTDTKTRVALHFRSGASVREGSINFNSDMSVEEIHDYFMKL